MFKVLAIDKFNVTHVTLRCSYQEAMDYCTMFIKNNPHAKSIKILDRLKNDVVKVVR